MDEFEDLEEEKTQKHHKGKETTNKFRCTSCGYNINARETPPTKTWNMFSPMPDKMGRVTLTIMGSFICPQCSKSIRIAMQKIKTDDEINGKSKKEVLLTTLQNLSENANLEEIAKNIGLSVEAVSKALKLLIQRGEVKGKIENLVFVPER